MHIPLFEQRSMYICCLYVAKHYKETLHGVLLVTEVQRVLLITMVYSCGSAGSA